MKRPPSKNKHQQLAAWLTDHGLETTWLFLLMNKIAAENAKTGGHLQNILQDKKFQAIKKINDDNLLDGLSMGQVAALYEFSLAHCDRAARKTAGQYFTPDDVAEIMAQKAMDNFGKDKNKIWCDPCAGVGNLSYYVIAAQGDPEEFLQHNIIFIDRDPLALLIARTLLAIEFQNKNENLFHDIEKKFIVADFLQDDPLPAADVMIFNPPYGQIRKGQVRKDGEGAATDLYAQFMERAMEKTKSGGGGFVAITPQSFTHAEKFCPLRTRLLEQGKKIVIYNFDNVPDNIFRGKKFGSENSNQANSTRAAITLFHHGHPTTNEKQFLITPLLRWRCAERATLLAGLDGFLTSLEDITPKIFPKISKGTKVLYLSTAKQETLSTILSNAPTDYCLFVPSTPRYFISALLQKPQRTSCRVLYFHRARDRDHAYILLNSSFCYWWWRVNDGGMTLSLKTLRSLPLINIQTSKQNKNNGVALSVKTMIGKIMTSEKMNRVVKRNAGRDNENVKHDKELIHSLNHRLMMQLPQHAIDSKMLLALHNNSVLS